MEHLRELRLQDFRNYREANSDKVNRDSREVQRIEEHRRDGVLDFHDCLADEEPHEEDFGQDHDLPKRERDFEIHQQEEPDFGAGGEDEEDRDDSRVLEESEDDDGGADGDERRDQDEELLRNRDHFFRRAPPPRFFLVLSDGTLYRLHQDLRHAEKVEQRDQQAPKLLLAAEPHEDSQVQKITNDGHR